MTIRRLALRMVFVLGSIVGLHIQPAEATTVRYVNQADPTCGGQSPCYGTIQAAITAAQAGDTVQIQVGTYVEQVQITGKNNTGTASETDRIVIQADPAAAGSVVLQGAVTQCTQGHAIRLQQSKYVTLRGLTITGAGGEGIALMGGNNQNTAIHLERNRIYGNGSGSCNGGITIARGNPDTLLVNNLIYGNGRNGLTFIDADGGPHTVIENTIHANAWSGVNVAREHQVLLANNAITGNGTASGSTGGRFGVTREGSTSPNPAGIQLRNNLVCGNRLGEIDGPALDATDSGNLTPTGAEGTGVTASPGCDQAATVFANVAGADGLANTADDSFTPATGSPLIDAGLDPRTLGLPEGVNSVLEADYLAEAVRPRAGTEGQPAQFDIGAVELGPPDTQAPAVAFQQPAANAFLRGSVTVEAQATDSGGVASVSLAADGQVLSATLVPTPPASSINATALWSTTGLPDGTHTLTASATDGAGNTGSVQRVVVVDNTAPDTQITGGPSGTVTGADTTVSFTGTDNLTAPANLLFAWRLDGGAFSEFSSITTVTLTGLSQGPHTFEVRARDQAGNEDTTPAQQAFNIASLQVTITEPLAGVLVPAGLLLVRGTVSAPGQDVGVSVNGHVALVEGSNFAVQVPVEAATTIVAATATAGTGASVTYDVAISVFTPSVPLPALTATPAGGAAPLTVQFMLGGVTPTSIALDLDGDGVADFTGPSLEGQRFAYPQPGLYFPVATVTDQQGGQFTVRAAVLAESPTALNAKFQGLWAAFKAKLVANDIPGALGYLSPTIQSQFAQVFQALGANLGTIGANLEDLVVVEQIGDLAEAVIRRQEGGTPLLYFVYFRRDSLGRWRIEEM